MKCTCDLHPTSLNHPINLPTSIYSSIFSPNGPGNRLPIEVPAPAPPAPPALIPLPPPPLLILNFPNVSSSASASGLSPLGPCFENFELYDFESATCLSRSLILVLRLLREERICSRWVREGRVSGWVRKVIVGGEEEIFAERMSSSI
jgi:hypothetical protein